MVLGDDFLSKLIGELSDRLGRPHPKSPMGVACENEKLSGLKLVHVTISKDAHFFDEERVVDFTSPRLPDFVTSIEGFVDSEGFGRWTTDDIARIRFDKPLPMSMRMIIKMRVHGPNINQPIVVVAGVVTKIIRARNHGMRTYKLNFSTQHRSKLLEFYIPHAIAVDHFTGGENPDMRRLGIGIESIVIQKSRPGILFSIVKLFRN